MNYIYKYIPKSTVPEGKSGDYEVRKFFVSKDEADLFNLGNMFNFEFHRDIAPGAYTKLVKVTDESNDKGILWMSDTPAEARGHLDFYYSATGNVLINGLGLGLIARAVLLKPDVEKVTINEINVDVIRLVAPHLLKEFGDRLVINECDAFTWKPQNGDRFNAVWHDIWPSICYDHYEEYKKLMRRYGHWLVKPHWQYCWEYDRLKRIHREERENSWRW